MYEEITVKFVRECTDALEFYDDYGNLPWKKKRVNIMISEANLKKLEGKNKSQIVEEALSYVL